MKIDGCPANFEQADEWAHSANLKREDWGTPWSFDCGFKLDFDGGLVSYSSRFYPPGANYGPMWSGWMTVCLGDTNIAGREFCCKTLDQLKNEVEAFQKRLQVHVQKLMMGNLKEMKAALDMQDSPY